MRNYFCLYLVIYCACGPILQYITEGFFEHSADSQTAGFFICLFTYYDRMLNYAARAYQVIREIVSGPAAVIGDNPKGNVAARQRRKEGHGKQE